MNSKDFNVFIRPITLDDTDDIVRWRNSENVKKYFIFQGDFTREGHLSWYNNKILTKEVLQFIIVEKENNTSIGSVFIRDIDYIHKKGEFGIFIGDDSKKGKGFGEQATKLILEYAFNVFKLHRIYLRVLADNSRAISCYKKAGFVIEGTLRDDALINGHYRDIVWMSMLNSNDSK